MKHEAIGGGNGVETRKLWEKEVWDAGKGRCSNCGGSDRVRARMVVPEGAGGQFVSSNGTLLCRACEFGLETKGKPESVKTKCPVNFWVSMKLFDRLTKGSEKTLFRSMAGLIRFLMTKYVSDPERFDDLDQFQDAGTDVKVNVWVEDDIYERFKVLADRNGQTVTDALKGLICLYEYESDRLRKE